MFGKKKRAQPVAMSNHFGWTDDRLAFLEKILSRERPQFEIPLEGFRQSYGRRVYDPHNPISDNELVGFARVFNARVEGRFGVAPIGTVGGLGMQGHGNDDNGYKPAIVFHLDLLDADQEFRLQCQLQSAFVSKITPIILLNLETVDNPNERIRELREEGSFDSLPLKSFCVITETGENI